MTLYEVLSLSILVFIVFLIKKHNKNMTEKTVKLLADVQAQTTLVKSLIQLVNNISQLLKDSQVDQAVIDQIDALANESAQEVTDALAANTPQA